MAVDLRRYFYATHENQQYPQRVLDTVPRSNRLEVGKTTRKGHAYMFRSPLIMYVHITHCKGGVITRRNGW